MKGEKLDKGDGEDGSKKKKSFKEKIKEAFEEQSIKIKYLNSRTSENQAYKAFNNKEFAYEME